MHVEQLDVRNVKLLADQQFNFLNSDGSPRQWTVILAENGHCKTTILQLIALLASGPVLGRQLVADPSTIANANSTESAHFGAVFKKVGSKGIDLSPTLEVLPGSRLLQGNKDSHHVDVLRAFDEPNAFVAGYGVGRYLPEPGEASPPDDRAIDRVEGLFRPQHKVLGIDFYEALRQFSTRSDEPKNLGLLYSRAIRRVLLSQDAMTDEPLLPDLNTFELRGKDGVAVMDSLLRSRRFEIIIEGEKYRLLPSSLSQGYQSSIAWICDLLGHAFLDASGEVDPSALQGIVLLDEIDLHLHPTWQRRLLPILGQVFPQLQFIVTTHSPLVLTGVDKESIIKLGVRQGKVVQLPHASEPGLANAATLLNDYFGVPRAGRPGLVALEREYFPLLLDPENNRERIATLEEQLRPFWEGGSKDANEEDYDAQN